MGTLPKSAKWLTKVALLQIQFCTCKNSYPPGAPDQEGGVPADCRLRLISLARTHRWVFISIFRLSVLIASCHSRCRGWHLCSLSFVCLSFVCLSFVCLSLSYCLIVACYSGRRGWHLCSCERPPCPGLPASTAVNFFLLILFN